LQQNQFQLHIQTEMKLFLVAHLAAFMTPLTRRLNLHLNQ
jgi:hypothetical protein